MSEPPGPSPHPALRASDADRERAVEVLRVAAGDGRLDVEELDERMSAVYATRTLAELEGLTVDLVPTPQGSPAHRAGGGMTVRSGPGGSRRIISVMSGSDRKGRWRVAARCLVLNLMGGCELDFSDAELSDAATTIRVVSVMGGGELRFPSGVDVQVTRFAFMGGNDVKLDRDPPPPSAPVIHVKLFALMGGNEVRQGRRGSKGTRELPRH